MIITHLLHIYMYYYTLITHFCYGGHFGWLPCVGCPAWTISQCPTLTHHTSLESLRCPLQNEMGLWKVAQKQWGRDWDPWCQL